MLNLIVSPRALRGSGKKLLEKVQARITQAGRELSVFITQRYGEATEIAHRLTGAEPCTLIAMGGDGTMNDVLNGIQNPEQCKFGIIPAGTGNDFAAAAKIPQGLGALDLILGGFAKPTDYIEFSDGRRSLNIAGLGIDVDILRRCERATWLRGRGKYFLSLLSSLFGYRGDRISVEVNGKQWETRAMIAAFCNGSQLGGGIPLCPPASLDDGKMDLVVVDYPKRSKILGALIKLMRGKVLSLPFAHHILCDTATVIPSGAGFAQYDGELYETERLSATLVAGKLQVFRG